MRRKTVDFQHDDKKKVYTFSFFVEKLLCDDDGVIMSEHMNEVVFPKANKSENFYQKIKKDFYPEWFMNQTVSWHTIYKPIFKEVLTRRGYGYAFNMLPESKLFTKE